MRDKKLIALGLFVGIFVGAGCGKSDAGGGASDGTASPQSASGHDTPGPSGGAPSGGSAFMPATDSKEVAVEPKKYAGKTLQSNLRLTGFGNGGAGFKDPINNTHVFFLKSTSRDMTEKLIRMSQVAGDYGFVVVTYKVDDDPSTDGGQIGSIVDVAMK